MVPIGVYRVKSVKKDSREGQPERASAPIVQGMAVMLAAISGIGTSTSTYCMYKVFKVVNS